MSPPQAAQRGTIVRLAEATLAHWLPRGQRSQTIVGDLREEHFRRLTSKPRGATIWYLTHGLQIAVSYGLRARASQSVRMARHLRASLRHELSLAARRVRRSRRLVLTTVPVLALALAVSATLYGVVRTVVLSALPYPDADRIVILRADYGNDTNSANLSPPEFRELRERVSLFDAVTGVWGDRAVLRDDDGSGRWHSTYWIAGGFRDVFGLAPVLGRTLQGDESPEDEGVMIVERLWRERFGGDPGVIGSEISYKSGSRPIVGVIPDEFELHTTALEARQRDFFEAVPGHWWSSDYGHRRLERWLRVFGKLEPDTTLARVNAELEALAAYWRASEEGYEGYRLWAVPLHEDLVGDVRGGLLALFGIALLVLCVGAGNVANLLLADAFGQRRQTALEVVLGASRVRLAWRRILEAGMLGGLAGTLAVVLSAPVLMLLPKLYPGHVPRLAEVGVSWETVAFALLTGAATGLLAGLPAAIRTLRSRSAREDFDARAGDGRQVRLQRSVLLAVQVSASVVLLVALSVAARSATRALEVDPGFDADGLESFRVAYPDDEPGEEFERKLVARIEATAPGVRAAMGSAGPLTLASGTASTVYRYQTYELPDGDELPWGRRLTEVYTVRPGWFEALGVRVKAGRTVTRRDAEEQRHVALVDEGFARRIWGERNPLGRRVRIGPMQRDRSAARVWTIIGIVGHVEQGELAATADRETQAFLLNLSPGPRGTVFVRAGSDSIGSLERLVQRVATELGSPLPTSNARDYSHLLAAATSYHRFLALLLATTGLIGGALTALGIYATLAYAMTTRAREIGLRRALGAPGPAVLRTMAGHVAAVVTVGLVAGLAIAWAAITGFEHYLFEVDPHDPRSAGSAVVAMLLTALAAGWLPARHALRISPIEALRGD